ncbi:MAG: hypothetical protein ACXVB9_03320 [Bdellovibrionota bacterium]
MTKFRLSFQVCLLMLSAGLSAQADPGETLCSGSHANLKPPANYCAAYDKTGPLRGDGQVQTAKNGCVKFYQEAISTVDVFCAYAEDAKKIQANGQTLSAGSEGQAGRRGSMRRAGELTGEARKSYEDFLVRIEQQFDRLKSVEPPYRNLIKRLAVVGEERLTKELHCEKSGEPGAEGAQVIGAAKYSLEAEMELTGFLNDLMKIFHRTLYNDWSAAKDIDYELQLRNQNLSDNGSDLKLRTAGARTNDGYSPTKSAAGLADDAVLVATSQASQAHGAGAAANVAEKELQAESSDIVKAEGKMLQRALSGAKFLAEPEALGVVVLSAFYFGLAEKIDGLTLTNLGTLVLGTVGGASVGAMIGLGVATDILETEIRARWEKIDSAIAAPYLNFTKQNPEMNSQQAAAGFAPQKAKRRICQACPLGPDCDWARFPYSKYNSDRTLLFGPTGRKDPQYDRTRVVTHPGEFLNP